MSTWTKSDKQIVIDTKRDHPRWSWDQIAELTSERHTARQCQKLYEEHQNKMRKASSSERQEEEEEEKEDGDDEEEPATLSPVYQAPMSPYKNWTKQEEQELLELREMQKLTFNAVAVKMKRTMASVKSKYYRIKEQQRRLQQQLQQHQDEDNTSKLPATPTLRNSSKAAGKKPAARSSSVGDDKADDRDDSSNKIKSSSSRPRKSWSTEEVEMLAHYRQQGLPWKEIASKLDRTVASCTSKWQSMLRKDKMAEQLQQERERSSSPPPSPRATSVANNKSSTSTTKNKGKPTDTTSAATTTNQDTMTTTAENGSRPYKFWTTDETEKLIEYRQKNMPWNVIAKKLGRSIPSCQGKFRRL